jgi:hypothetical protein
MPNLYMALTHYPVVNKNGDKIASAVTNLDLHDMSRLAKTYGIKSFYVVTPLCDQKKLIERIVSHWTKGAGLQYNPARAAALQLIDIKKTLEDVVEHIKNDCGSYPKIVVTSAKAEHNRISMAQFRDMLKLEQPYLLIFGTAWGLSEELVSKADYVLEPIKGFTEYNHLSVRSASAIILDRLLGSGF